MNGVTCRIFLFTKTEQKHKLRFLEKLTSLFPFGKEIWKKFGKYNWFKGTIKSFSTVYDDGEQTVEAGFPKLSGCTFYLLVGRFSLWYFGYIFACWPLFFRTQMRNTIAFAHFFFVSLDLGCIEINGVSGINGLKLSPLIPVTPLIPLS